MNEDIAATLKIVVLGESGVGKSSLVLRLTDDEFNPSPIVTIGVDYKTKILTVGGLTVRLAIWDTAGAERFRSLTPNFYRDAVGAILVYDVTERQTLTMLDTWLNELDLYSTKKDIVKMVVANKIDKDNRDVTTEEGMAFARKHATLFIESSAKTKDGVLCAFEELAEKIIQTPDLWQPKNYSNERLSLENENKVDSCTGLKCSISS